MNHPIVTIEGVKIIVMGIPIRTNPGCGLSTVCLLSSNKRWLLFDVGHYGNRKILLENLKFLEISPKDINYIALSHLHWDHCLNVSLFPNAKIILSEKELNYANNILSGKQNDTAIARELIEYLLKYYKIKAFCDNLVLDEQIEFFETPGHTPGSISLKVQKNKKIIICGDAIKNYWEFTRGVSDMICGSTVEDSQESMDKIKANGNIYIPGHDRPFFIKDNEVHFIGKLNWSLWSNAYPYEKGKLIYRVDDSLFY